MMNDVLKESLSAVAVDEQGVPTIEFARVIKVLKKRLAFLNDELQIRAFLAEIECGIAVDGAGERVPAGWHMSIVDSCVFGRYGWRVALRQAEGSIFADGVVTYKTLSELYTNLAWQNAATDGDVFPLNCLVVRLSAVPQQALLQLLELGEFAVLLSRFCCLVIVSPFSLQATRDVLEGVGVHTMIRVVMGRRGCFEALPAGHKVLSAQHMQDSPEWVLTTAERRVLQQTLRGISVNQQAQLNHVSQKTIYSQRSRALLKLRARDVVSLLLKFVHR